MNKKVIRELPGGGWPRHLWEDGHSLPLWEEDHSLPPLGHLPTINNTIPDLVRIYWKIGLTERIDEDTRRRRMRKEESTLQVSHIENKYTFFSSLLSCINLIHFVHIKSIEYRWHCIPFVLYLPVIDFYQWINCVCVCLYVLVTIERCKYHKSFCHYLSFCCVFIPKCSIFIVISLFFIH